MYGTNTSNALLELLSGKTRSNILASVLQAPEVLEDAYQTALNSAGVGDKEFAAYAESLDAKLTKLQNRIQELAAVSIDSDWLKVLVDLGTSAVRVLTSIIDKTGSLVPILGTISGILISTSKNDILKGTKYSNALQLLGDVGKQARDSILIRKAPQIEAAPTITETTLTSLLHSSDDNAINRLTNNLELGHNAKNGIEAMFGDLDNWKEEVNKLPVEVQDVINRCMPEIEAGKMNISNLLSEIKLAASNTGDAIVADTSSNMGEIQSIISSRGTAIKGALSKLGNVAANIIGSMASMLVVGLVMKLVTSAVDYIKNYEENIKKAAEDAQNEINKIQEGLTSKESGIKDLAIRIKINKTEVNDVNKNLEGIAKRYTELKKGVNEFTNANKNLSNEKYQEYLDISNELAKQFPTLVKGYDAQGTAMLNLGDDSVTCADKLQSVYDITKEIANMDISTQLNDVIKSAQLQANITIGELRSLLAEKEQLEAKLNEFGVNQTVVEETGERQLSFASAEMFNEWYDATRQAVVDSNKYAPDAGDMFDELLDEAYFNGDDFKEIAELWFQDQSQEPLKFTIPLELDGVPILTDEILSVGQAAADAVAMVSDAYIETENQLNAKQESIIDKEQDLTQSMVENVKARLTTNQNFLGSVGDNEGLFSAIVGNIGNYFNLSPETLLGDNFNIEEFAQHIIDLFYKASSPLSSETVQAGLEQLLNEDLSQINASELESYITNRLNEIIGDAEIATEVFEILPFKKKTTDVQENLRYIGEALGPFGFTEDELKTYTVQQAQKNASIIAEQLDSFDNIDDYYSAIDKSLEPADRTGKFSDLMNDKEFEDASSLILSNIKAITAALEEMEANAGNLSGTAYNTLVDTVAKNGLSIGENPTMDSLRELGSQQLSLFANQMDKSAESLELNNEALAEANTYVLNLFKSYDSLNKATSEDIIGRIYNNQMTANGIGAGFRQKEGRKAAEQAAKQYQADFTKEFEAELGNEKDRQILYSISVTFPESASWKINEWRKQFDNVKLNWQAGIDTEQFQKDSQVLEDRLTALTTDDATQKSMIETKAIKGNFDSTNELDNLIANNEERIEILEEQRERLYDINNPDSPAYKSLIGADNDVIEKAQRDAENQAQELINSIDEVRKDTLAKNAEKAQIPLNIITNEETKSELHNQYDNLLEDLGKYGEEAQLNPQIFNDFLDKASQIIANDNEKINIYEAILANPDEYTNEFIDQVTGWKQEAEKELESVDTNITTYTGRSTYGSDLAEIARLQAGKSLFTSTQGASGVDMGESGYATIEEWNTQLEQSYDKTISMMASKLDQMASLVGGYFNDELGQLAGASTSAFTADQQKDFEELMASWRTLVEDRATLLAEMRENDLALIELPIEDLEKNASKLEEKYSELEGNIDNKNSSSSSNYNVYTSMLDTATQQRDNAIQRRSIYQQQMDEAERLYGGTDNEAWRTAEANFSSADADVKKFTQNIRTLNEELAKIPENQARVAIEYNNSMREAESSALELRQKMGEVLSTNDYSSLLGFDENDVKLQEKLLEIAQKNLDDYLATFTNRTNMSQFEQDQVHALQGMVNAQQAVVDQARGTQYTDEQEAALADTNVFSSKLEGLKTIYEQYTAEYEAWIAKGGEMTDQQYRDLKTSIATQKTWLEGLQGVYERLAKDERFANDEAFQQQLAGLKQDVQTQLDNLDATQLKLDIEYDDKTINHLRRDLEVLGQENEALQRDLDKTDSITAKAGIINQMISNNDEQLTNLRAQTKEFQDEMDSIKESYLNNEDSSDDNEYMYNDRYVELANNLANATSQMDALSNSTAEYYALLQSLPMEQIQRNLELTDARQGVEEAKRSQKEANGGIVGKSDYNRSVVLASTERTLRENAYYEALEAQENAQRDYDEAGTATNLKLLNEAKIAVLQAEADYYQADADLAKIRKEQSDAALNEYRAQLQELDARKAVLDSEQSLANSQGRRLSKQELQDSYDLSQEYVKAYTDELETFEDEHVGQKLTPEELATKNGIIANINQYTGQGSEIIKQMLEKDSEVLMDMLDEASDSVKSATNDIEDLENAGKEIPDVAFDVKINTLTDEQDIANQLESFFHALADKYRESNPEWAEAWEEQAEQFADQARQLGIEIQTTTEDKAGQALLKLGYQLDDLKQKGQDIQRVLGRSDTPKSVQMYSDAIANAEEQQKNLTSQITKTREQMVGLDEGSAKYQRLQGQLRNLENEYDNLTDSIYQWHDAIEDLPLEAIERMVQYLSVLSATQDVNRNIKQANGQDLTREDYVEDISIAESGVTQAEAKKALADNDVAEAIAALNYARLNPNDKKVDAASAQAKLELALTKQAEAEKDVLQSQLAVLQARKAVFDAGQAEYEKARGFLTNYKSALDSERELSEALGNDSRGGNAIMVDVDISTESRENLIAQLEDLDNNHVGMTALEYAQKRVELENAIRATEKDVVSLGKEFAELPIKNTQLRLKLLQESGDELDRMIKSYSNLDKAIPDNLLADKLLNVQDEKKNVASQMEFYNGLINNFEDSTVGGWAVQFADMFGGLFGKEDFGDMFTQGWKDKLAELQEEFLNLQSEEAQTISLQYTQAFNEIDYALNDIKRNVADTQKLLGDDSVAKTPELYKQAIKEAGEQQAELVKQINLTKEEMNKFDFNDPEYQRLKGVVEGLEDEFDNLTESTNEWAKALRNLPIDSAINAFNDFKERIEIKEGDEDAIANMFGLNLTAEDFQKRAENYAKLAQEAYAIAQSKANQAAGMQQGSPELKALDEERKQWIQTAHSYEFMEQYGAMLEAAKAPLTELEREMKDIQNEAQAVQQDVDALVQAGTTGTVAQYQTLNEFNKQQADNIQQQIVEQEAYRQRVIEIANMANEKFGWNIDIENSTILQSVDESINQLRADYNALVDSTRENNLMINGGIALHELQNELTELEQANTRLNNQLNSDQSKGLSVYAETYEEIADNTLSQIDNLKKQNTQLERQQMMTGQTAEGYKQIQEQIEANLSSMSQLNQTFDDYQKKLANYAENTARELGNTISSALSESLSDTGLSSDTMQNLLGQFRQVSEIADSDLSNVFTKTAQGIKLNVEEMKRLVTVQRDAFSRKTVDNITKENTEIKKQTTAVNANKSAVTSAMQSSINGHQKNIEKLQEELVQYNAIMTSVERQIDAFAEWQNAESTENQGARYDTILNSMVDMENRANYGLTDTDEFRKFVEMMSTRGIGDAEEFGRIYETITRYFETGEAGLQNFLADLQSNGFDINGVIDLEDVSRVFGLSEVAIQTIVDKLKEKGTEILTIRDDLDASAQIIEKSNQLVQAINDKNQASMDSNLAGMQEAEAKIELLREQIAALSDAGQNYVNDSLITTSEEYEAAKDAIEELKAEYESATDPQSKSTLLSAIKSQMADIYGEVNDLDGVINLDFLDFEEYTKQAQDFANALKDIYPDVDQMTAETIREYQSGLQQLKAIAGTGIDWNIFNNLTGDSDEKIKAIDDYINKLKNIQITTDVTPETQRTLDTLLAIAGRERNLEMILKFREDIGQATTVEELAQLTDDQLKQVILAPEIDGMDAENVKDMINFIRGKAQEVPLTVKLDTASITALTEALSGIELNGKFSETTKQDMQKQINTWKFNPINIAANISNVIGGARNAISNWLGVGKAHGGELTSDTKALVNEVGTESIVTPQGEWHTIPGGMHVENLEKGSVVLNHKQTEDIIKHGKASGKGKIVGGDAAFAHGTMPAFANGLQKYTYYQSTPGSKQTFDLIETRIQILSQDLNRLSDVIKSNTTAENKYANAIDRQNNILKQTSLYQDQASEYRLKADKYAQQYLYYDDKGNERTLNLENSVKHLFGHTLEEFANGTADVTEIDTSSPNSQIVLKGLQEYIDLVQKANSATDAVYDLNQQLYDVTSSILQIPFDTLNKALHDIGNEASRISAFSSVAQNGDVAIANLDRMLHELFGDEADSMFNAAGTSLDVANRLVEENLATLKETVEVNMNAYKDAKKNLEDLQTQSQEQGETFEAKKSEALKVSGLSKEMETAILEGEMISKDDLANYKGSDLKVLQEYNDLAQAIMLLAEELKEAQVLTDDQLVEVQKAAADASVAEANLVQEYMDNTSSYYDTRSNYYQALAGRSKTMADVLGSGKISNHAGEVQGYLQQSANQINQAIAEEQTKISKLKEAADGVTQGTKEWYDYQTQILNAESSLSSLRGTLSSLYDEMGNIPTRVTQERLQDLQYQYSGLTNAISSGLTESSASINAYNRLAAQLGAPNALAGLGISGGPGYQATNALLDQQVQMAQQEAAIAVEGYRAAMAYLEQMMLEAAQAPVDAEDAARKQANVEKAQKAVNEAKNLMDQKVMNAAVMEVQNFEKSVRNIDNYYQNIVAHMDTMLNSLKIAKSYMEVGNGYSVNGANIEANLQQQLAQVQQQQGVLAQDVAEMEARLAQGVANGTIQVGDETWLALDTSINQVRNSMQNLQLTQLQLYEELANVPNKVVEAKLKDIENAFNGVMTAMNKNLTMSRGAISIYRQMAGAIGQDIFAGMGDRSEYEFQDYLMDQNIDRLQQEVDVAVQGFREAEAKYYAGGTEEQIRLAKQAMETARSVMNDKMMELAVQKVQKFLDGMKNIEQYYQNINGYIDAQIEGLQLQNQLMQDLRGNIIGEYDAYIKNIEEMGKYIEKQIQYLEQASQELKDRLEEGLASGAIQYGDQAWYQAMTQIQNVDNQISKLRLNQRDVFKDLLEAPAKKAEEMLDKLAYKYRILNATIEGEILTSASAIRQWNQIVKEMNDKGKLHRVYNINPFGQTDLQLIMNQIDEEVKKENETLEIYADELMAARVNASKLWDDPALKAEADQKVREAEIQYLNQQAKLAQLRVEKVAKKMDAIAQYYEGMNESLDTDIRILRSDREYNKEYNWRRYSPRQETESYVEEYNAYSDEIENTKTEIKQMEAQLEKGIKDGLIIRGDEKYTELNNKIKQSTLSLKGMQKAQRDVSKEMARMPIDRYEKAQEQADIRYSRLNAITGNGLDQDLSTINTLITLSNNRRLIGPTLRKSLNKADESVPIMPVNEHQARMTYILGTVEESDQKMLDAYRAAREAHKAYANRDMRGTDAQELLDAANEAMRLYYEAEAENVKVHYEAQLKLLDSLKSYYDSLNNLISATTQLAESKRNNIINFLGYKDRSNQNLIVSSYGNSIIGGIKQQENNATSAILRRAQLQKGVNDGDIDPNGTAYRDQMADILNTEAEIENLKAQYLDLMKEMLTVPNKIIEEKIREITTAYAGLTEAINSGALAMSGSQRFYKQMADTLSRYSNRFASSDTNFVNGGRAYTDTDNAPTFARQNQALADDFARQKEVTNMYIQQALAAQDIYNGLQGASEEQVRIAKQNMEETEQKAYEEIAKLAKAQFELLTNMIDNIMTYYNRINEYIGSINNNLKSTIDYMTQTSGFAKNYSRLVQSYNSSINNTRQQMQTLVNEIIQVQNQMRQTAFDVDAKETDDEYIELATKLRGLQDELVSTTGNLYDLFEAFYSLPGEVASEQIDKLAKSFMALTSSMNASALETTGTQRALKSLALEMAKTNKYFNPEQLNFASATGETFVGQNAALLLDLKKDREELGLLNQALIEAGQNYERLAGSSTYYPARQQPKPQTQPTVEVAQDYDDLVREYDEQVKKYSQYRWNAAIEAAGDYPDAFGKERLPMDDDQLIEYDPTDYINMLNATTTELNQKYKDAYKDRMKHQLDVLQDQGLIDESFELPGVENLTDELLGINNRVKEVKAAYSDLSQMSTSTFGGQARQIFTDGVKDITVPYGKTQEELIAAEKALEDARQKFLDKLAESSVKAVQYITSSVENINTYYNQLIQHQTAIQNGFESMLKVIQEVGRAMDNYGNLITDTTKVAGLYAGQLLSLTKQQQRLAESIVEQQDYLELLKISVGEDTEEYRELESQILSLQNQFNETTIAKEALEDAMRQELYIKPFDDAISRLQALRGNLMGISGLIDDESKFDENGNYTDLGLLNLGLNVEAYEVANERLDQERQKYNKILERWREDASYSDEEFLADSQSSVSAIQSAMQDMNSSRQAMLASIKTRYKTEIDYIKKLIQAQSDQLAKQKELADYDRNLKDKTNAVKQIEMQLRALENLSDAESNAQRARLQEQLKNSRDDLDETVENHVVSMRQDALSELAKKFDDIYEKFIVELSNNTDRTNETIESMKLTVSNNMDRINDEMIDFLGKYNSELTMEMATGTSAIVNKFTDISNKDFQHTNQMENAKALKLAEYERLKQEAMANHEQNQAARDAELKRLEKEYDENRDEDDTTANSYLKTIDETETSINSTLTNLDKFLNEKIDAKATDIATAVSNAANTVKTSVDQYNSDGSILRTVVPGILAEVRGINNALEAYLLNVERAKEEAEKYTASTGNPDDNLYNEHLEEEKDYSKIPITVDIGGKKYILNDEGYLDSYSKTTTAKKDTVTTTANPLGQGVNSKTSEGIWWVYESENGKTRLRSQIDGHSVWVNTSELDSLGQHWVIDSSGQRPVGSGIPYTYSPGASQRHGILTKGDIKTTTSSYSLSDVVTMSSLKAGKYTNGGQTKIDGNTYIILTGVESFEEGATDSVGKIVAYSDFFNNSKKLHYNNDGTSTFEVGNYSEVAAANKRYKENPITLHDEQIVEYDNIPTGHYKTDKVVESGGKKYAQISQVEGDRNAALMKGKYIDVENIGAKINGSNDYRDFTIGNYVPQPQSGSQQPYSATAKYDDLSDLSNGNYLIDKGKTDMYGKTYHRLISGKDGKQTNTYISSDYLYRLGLSGQQDQIEVSNHSIQRTYNSQTGAIKYIGGQAVAAQQPSYTPTTTVNLGTNEKITPTPTSGASSNKYTFDNPDLTKLPPGQYQITFVGPSQDRNRDEAIVKSTDGNYDYINLSELKNVGISPIKGTNFIIDTNRKIFEGAYAKSANKAGTQSEGGERSRNQGKPITDYTKVQYNGRNLDFTQPGKYNINHVAPLAPQNVKDVFNQLGFGVVVDPGFKLGEGYFNGNFKRVTVTNGTREHVYHELGHFVAALTGNTDTCSAFQQLFREEAQNFQGTYKGYAQKNGAAEYFAEAFREYILHPNDLKSWVPKTYDYIKKIISRVTPEQAEKYRQVYSRRWEAYDKNQFAKGTTHAPKGLAQVFEEGPEIITTAKGTFVPFEGGEGVIPAEQTRTLMNLADAFNEGKLGLQMPDMSGYQIPNVSSNTNYNNNIHFDSLITINGNATADTVQEIKQIAQQLVSNKQFQENVTQFVSKRQASDGRMAGKRINVI